MRHARMIGKFASYLRRVLCNTRLTFPHMNGPILYSMAALLASRHLFVPTKDIYSSRPIGLRAKDQILKVIIVRREL